MLERWLDAIGGIGTLYLALEWSIRLWMFPIVLRRHRPSVALAWLAVIFFQPPLGVVLYWMLGRQVLGKIRIRQHAQASEAVRTSARLAAEAPFAMPVEMMTPAHRDMLHLAQSIGDFDMLSGNSVTLHRHTEEVVRSLTEAIDGACEHVHLLYYILLPDENGRLVCDALERAAARGVRCCLLVDAVGSKQFLKIWAARLKKSGVIVESALPVKLLRQQFARVDVRNHRKLAVIDGRTAFCGSHNMCNPDYGQRRYGAWHDLTAHITGPVVHQLQTMFIEDWLSEGQGMPEESAVFPTPQKTGPFGVQTIPSGPGELTGGFRDLMVALINEADERLIMTTPYFVPDEPTMLALKLRARAGVEVDIIVPERTNSMLVRAASRAFFDELLDSGVHIHLYKPGMLHAKTTTVDDTLCMIGSGNLDRRSFGINYELNLLMMGREVCAQLRGHQEHYISQSRPLTQEELGRRSRVRVIADDAAKLFGPLL